MTLRIGVPREVKPGENRVALTPRCVGELAAAGAAVSVESGAGRESGFPDEEYAGEGAGIVAGPQGAWDADLVVKVKEPFGEELGLLSEKTALFAYLHLAVMPELAAALLSRRVTAVAYETVSEGGALPLLSPMSEVAGILSVQVGARGLEKSCGGRGVLLAGVSGTEPATVCVIGAGTAGTNAARTAAGAGARVLLLDLSRERLEKAALATGGKVRTVVSTPGALEEAVKAADLVISTVLVVGEKAPVLIPRRLLRKMNPGAVVVDVSIDQGGTLETSRPTTHAAPYFVEEGVVHYCVSNMPGAVPRTATVALASATLPYLLSFVRSGVSGALRTVPALRRGLNTYGGNVTCEGVARALGRAYVPAEDLLFEECPPT